MPVQWDGDTPRSMSVVTPIPSARPCHHSRLTATERECGDGGLSSGDEARGQAQALETVVRRFSMGGSRWAGREARDVSREG